MSQFALADPARYVAFVVNAAVAGGASFVRVQAEGGECLIDFDGESWDEAELESLFTAPFEPASSGRARALARGLYGALEIDPKGVTLESWGEGSGWRLKVARDGPRVEKLAKPPWKDGARLNRVKVGEKGGFFAKLGKKKAEAPPEEAVLDECCALAPLKLTLNERDVAAPYAPPGKCLLWSELTGPPEARFLCAEATAKVRERRASLGGSYAGTLSVGDESDEPPRTAFLVHGTSFPETVDFLVQAGIQGLVAAPGLMIKADGSAIEHDEKWDSLLEWLEQEASKMLILLTSSYNKINELERVLADWNVKKLARWHRDREEFEPAERLYRHLLERQEKKLGADHADAGETAKILFEFYQSQGRTDDLQPLYARMLSVLESSGQKSAELVYARMARARQAQGAERWDEAESYAGKALPVAEEVFGKNSPEVAVILRVLAHLYRARYPAPHPNSRKVEPLLERALEIQHAQLDEQDPELAATLHETAEFLRSQRRYSEAEPFYTQALAIREPRADTRELAETLEGIGHFFAEQGVPDEASPYYTRALEIWDKVLGSEHPDVARRLLSLVELYRVYGRYSEAEPLYQRVLDIRSRTCGPDDPALVQDLCNLALFYQAQGKHSEAEPLLSRAAEIVENSMGADHVENAWVLNLLGKSYDEEGRFDESEAVYHRALEICENALGADHPDLAVTLDSLVLHYRLQDRTEEAEALAGRALELREQCLGSEHPEVGTNLATLGEILRSAGREEEAMPLYTRSYETRRRWLEGDARLNPSNTTWRKDQSHYYSVMAEADELQTRAQEPARVYKRFAEAEHLYRRASLMLEQTLGPSHPALCVGLEKLADLYCSHRRYAGAEELLLRAKAIREESLGPDHPDVILSLQRLIEVCRRQQMFAEAEPLAVRWLEIAEQTAGPDHPQTARALAVLGGLLAAQARAKEAEPLLRRALDIRKQKLGPDHLDSAISLAEFYCVRGEYTQAEGVFQLVMASREDAPDLLPFLERYGEMLRKMDRSDEADVLDMQATIIRVSHGMDFPE